MKESVEDVQNSEEYGEGKAAFARGHGDDICPHAKGLPRRNWMMGFMDARTNDRLRDLFKRNKVSYP